MPGIRVWHFYLINLFLPHLESYIFDGFAISSNIKGSYKQLYMRKIILSLLISQLIIFSVNSQTKDKKPYDPYSVKLDGNYLKGYWQDTKNIYSAPFRWKAKDWIKTATVLGISTGLYFGADQQLKDWSQREKNETSEAISKSFEIFGNGRYPVFTTGALYLAGVAIKKEKPKRVALLILESYLITGVTAQLSKFLTSRERPWSKLPYNVWYGPRIKDPKASFFSGHSSTVWAFATVFALEYSKHKWVAPVAYTIATLSSISRIHDNAHWASDVFFGSVIGYYMTRSIVRNHTKNNRTSFFPVVGRQGMQLGFVHKF